MDIKKTSKFVDIVDASQVVNNLLTKIADVIISPREETNKKLLEIGNILINLKQIDKTATYLLAEDTIDKVNKALSRVELPDQKFLKSIGIETPGPNKTFKLEAREIPKTEEQAINKINQLVNSNLDNTIKVINDITTIKEAEDKVTNVNVDSPTGEKASKVLTDILLTLLATSLKETRDLEFPEITQRNIEEINLNEITRRKQVQSINEVEAESEKINEGVPSSFSRDTKENVELESASKIRKTAFGIGQFPSSVRKDIAETVSPSGFEDKVESRVNYNLARSAKQGAEIGEAIDPIPVGIEVVGAIEVARKKSNAGYTDIYTIVPPKGARKPGSPNEWYGNWGFLFGNPNNPSNNIANGNLSFAGISATNVNAFTRKNFGKTLIGGNLQRSIGSTLTFFGITSSDVGRFVNSSRRYLNTTVNAFELLSQIISIETRRDFDAGNNARRRLESFINVGPAEPTQAAFNNEEYGIKKFGKNALDQDNLPPEQQEMMNQLIKERGKLVTTEEGPNTREGNYAVSDTTLPKEKFKPGTDLYYIDNYRERTFAIVKGADTKVGKATGFLKIYTKRGPKFENSQSEFFIIPFQFEPTVGSDSKAADYATITTLARSQAAQVYRRSSERNITLELDYVVIQPPSQSNEFVSNSINEAPSKSMSDMVGWDEDYIYNYIVRMMRNLVLPNIIGPQHKLAPPIVQVWYGGISSNSASSTGDGIVDPNNEAFLDVYPTFRTNWFDETGNQRSYRSLWVCKNVSFEYKGGIINRSSRNRVWVTTQLQLTEIAPSVTDNEVMLWRRLT